MELIHPVYLDVPMVMSFAAALQGGVSLETDVTREEGGADARTNESKARISLSGLVGNMLGLAFSKDKTRNESSTHQEVVRESRSHTEASIAIIVYDLLQRGSSLLTKIESVDQLDALTPGSLVEVVGRIEKNAVDAMIDYMGAVKIMMGLDTSQSAAQLKAAIKPVARLHNALCEDRKRTPISNVVVRCREPEDLSAVLTLRTDNLRDLTLSELHKNEMRVVGKLTRRVPAGESMKTFENYGLGLLDKQTLEGMFAGVAQTDGVEADFADVEMPGPAIQLLPLMVFV